MSLAGLGDLLGIPPYAPTDEEIAIEVARMERRLRVLEALRDYAIGAIALVLGLVILR